MPRLLDHAGNVIDDWHPLDGGVCPDYVPPDWDAPHASKRLIEALRVLARLPMPRGPQQHITGWPSYYHDWEDLLAQQEAEQVEKDRDQREQNRTRILPTSIEIMRMEEAIGWLPHYLGYFPQLLVTCGMVALAKARYRDLSYAAHRLHLPEHLVRRWNRQGLDMVAAGLFRDAVPLF